MFDPDINYSKFLEHCNNKVDDLLENDEIDYTVVTYIAVFPQNLCPSIRECFTLDVLDLSF